MPTIAADEGAQFDRQALLRALRGHDIEGRVLFCPLSLLPMLATAGSPPVTLGRCL